MILDNNALVMDEQAITSSGTVSENSIDLEVLGREIGTGQQLAFHLSHNGVAMTGTSSRIAIEVIVADNAALTGNVRVVACVESQAGPLKVPGVLGWRLVAPIPPQLTVEFAERGSTGELYDVPASEWSGATGTAGHRYIGLRVSDAQGGSDTITSLTLSAHLAPLHAATTHKSYPTSYEA